MKRFIGDHIGTTWDDALVLPGAPTDDLEFSPEEVDLSTDLAGVNLGLPYIGAAMRSVTGKELALAAGKLASMAVAPRGLSIEREVEIVEHVKKNEVKPGEIEYEYEPTTALLSDNLGSVIQKARKTGHDNIPILGRKTEFEGMFTYKPSEHDNRDLSIPIKKVMNPCRKDGGKRSVGALSSKVIDKTIKRYLTDNDLRLVPIVDNVGRLDRLVFLQKNEAYKVGAAIDTHKGWRKRVEKLAAAGADMIFLDTSDAHKPFSRRVVESYARLIKKYKAMSKDLPPICAGNVVTADAFDYLVKAGADVIKIGMGPGSICSTNDILGVGAPPLWSLIEVAKRRDEHALEKGGKYIPIIADGGIEGTGNLAVVYTNANAAMLGNMYGCFLESEGDRYGREGSFHKKGMIDEGNIVGIRIYGEGSEEAMQTSGDLHRYAVPMGAAGVTTYQGVSGVTAYRGLFKPGVEGYARANREAIFHAGCRNLHEYRQNAVLVRLSERAKQVALPHGIQVL